MEALDRLIQQGKVRYIGCSNYSGWHIMKAMGVARADGRQPFVSQQIHYTLQAREAEYELVPISIDQGLGISINKLEEFTANLGGRLPFGIAAPIAFNIGVAHRSERGEFVGNDIINNGIFILAPSPTSPPSSRAATSPTRSGTSPTSATSGSTARSRPSTPRC